MVDCTKCKHKNNDSKCFVHWNMNVKPLKKAHKVKYTFEFNADDDWTPGEGVCWIDCPFSVLIGWGNVCKGADGKTLCPFLRKKYSLKIKK